MTVREGQIRAIRNEFEIGWHSRMESTTNQPAVEFGAVTDADRDALVASLRRVVGRFSIPAGHEAPKGTAKHPDLFVEVGTLSGRSTSGIYETLRRSGWYHPRLVTIDKDRWRESVLGRFKNGEIVEFFHGTATEWASDGRNQGLQIAWAFIDGCHCEECVSADIAALAPIVVPGGEICFHDAGDQRDRGQKVCARYHDNDGAVRMYGVSEAIAGAPELKDFVLVEKVPALERGHPTPLFGGLQVWERKNGRG